MEAAFSFEAFVFYHNVITYTATRIFIAVESLSCIYSKNSLYLEFII
jgi:hypothetical protein